MFEHSTVEEKGHPLSFWLKIIGVVAIALIIINVFRVNSPQGGGTPPVPVVEDTKGPVVQDAISIEPSGFVPYRIAFRTVQH